MNRYIPSALFWDYENVPLRNNDWEDFLDSLDLLINSIPFDFMRIYAQRTSMSETDRELLDERGYGNDNIKLIKSSYKNAADLSLMKSCIDVLRSRQHIKQILLITGDGDFEALANMLPDIHISVICQGQNYSQKLIEAVDEAVTVDYFTSNASGLLK